MQTGQQKHARSIGSIALAVLAAITLFALSGGLGHVLGWIQAGERRGLQAALFQSAPLRTTQDGLDRAYLVSTQSESVYFGSGRGVSQVRRDDLHVDLWAIDAASATVAWRRRLRTFEGSQREGRMLTGFEILGVDGTTLWLNAEGPVGVSLKDGSVVADASRIEKRNPSLAGKLVTQRGYIAFGRNGLQLTLSDASQWRIDANDLLAAPRDTPVRHPEGIVPPANPLPSTTSSFQVRSLSAGQAWLGVLTDAEADELSHPPVIPGRDTGERPGALQQFLNDNHVPQPLNNPLPRPYRLWQAKMTEVSAAPQDWPKELPDNWGKRSEFSEYKVLADAPAFLRAGLLRQHRHAEIPLWYRDPDSVLVLHVDKLGDAGRLQLTRVSGPNGKVVWQAPLPMASLASVMHGDHDLLLWGSVPDVADDGRSGGHPWHQVLVRVDVPTGKSMVLDLIREGFTHEPTPGSKP
ncbi:MAG: hypothetical protein IPP82_06235 [Xanthomonadales bacterium]|nr:hypothetical protein [Xanthomonadales bacterium]